MGGARRRNIANLQAELAPWLYVLCLQTNKARKSTRERSRKNQSECKYAVWSIWSDLNLLIPRSGISFCWVRIIRYQVDLLIEEWRMARVRAAAALMWIKACRRISLQTLWVFKEVERVLTELPVLVLECHTWFEWFMKPYKTVTFLLQKTIRATWKYLV